MTHDFEQDFAFSVTTDAHALVRRACHRLIEGCRGVARASAADDRRGVDYWVMTDCGRIGLDLKLRRQDYGARTGQPLDCVVELESHGTGGWLLKAGGADLILFAAADTHRVALFYATKLRTAVLLNLAHWLKSGAVKEITTRSTRDGAGWSSRAVIIPADLLESAIDALADDCANEGGWQ